MADKKNHITNSKDYQRYLDGDMSAKERHSFERHLLDDDFESEALEGLAQLDSRQLDDDLNQLRYKLGQRREKNVFGIYWRIAASLLLLGIFSFIIYFTIEFNSTSEIAESKETIPEEKIAQADEPPEIAYDSVQENERTAIAYNQPPEEKVKEQETQPSQAGKSLPPIAQENENAVEAMILDIEDEIVEADRELPEVEPLDLPTLAKVQEVEMDEISESAAQEESSKLDMIAAAPAAAKKAQSSAARREQAAGFVNTKTITGKVYSVEDDLGIPGVNVIVKGGAVGTITDMEGAYSIEVPVEEDVTLVYSFIGLSSQEVNVEDKSNIDVNMEPDLNSLSEIVVTAYGSSDDYERPDYSYTPPEPIGGNGKFKDYIKENIQYPESGLAENTKGTVKLKFTVGVSGSIQKLEVIKSLGDDFDKEAIRLLKEGPKWEPAMENNSPVSRDVKLKIRFRPPE